MDMLTPISIAPEYSHGLNSNKDTKMYKYDVIKQNESELANIDFKIQSIITFNFLCILSF